MDRVFLAVVFLVTQLVQLEHELATVDARQRALVVNDGNGFDDVFRVLLIQVPRDRHHDSKQVADYSPDFAKVFADSDEEVTVITEGETGNLASVLVLRHHIVEELVLVELDNIENFLCLLQLLSFLEVLETIRVFELAFDLCNVLLEDAHSLLTLTHGDQKEAVQSLALALHSEDELLHL